VAGQKSREPEHADRALVITRDFDAPRALVWKCWTDPEHGRRWGPAGFTMAHVEGDLRPGGVWRACLRPDDGGPDLWQGGVYREVVEPERLVFTFAWDDESGRPGHETLVTLTFAERNGRTTMTFRQEVFQSAAERDGHRVGWNEAFDRMAALLAAVRSS
jgi:uncharacterized protein YndB with AHSA1/START domain